MGTISDKYLGPIEYVSVMPQGGTEEYPPTLDYIYQDVDVCFRILFRGGNHLQIMLVPIYYIPQLY